MTDAARPRDRCRSFPRKRGPSAKRDALDCFAAARNDKPFSQRALAVIARSERDEAIRRTPFPRARSLLPARGEKVGMRGRHRTRALATSPRRRGEEKCESWLA